MDRKKNKKRNGRKGRNEERWERYNIRREEFKIWRNRKYVLKNGIKDWGRRNRKRRKGNGENEKYRRIINSVIRNNERGNRESKWDFKK